MLSWKSPLWGCFDDIGACKLTLIQIHITNAANNILFITLPFLSFSGLIAWIVPCWSFGKVAEDVGEDCLIYGILGVVPIVHGYFR